jgi:soluble lytic murein transglycosylase-like protein
MNDVQKAIFPAILIGVLVVFAITRAILNPQISVQAASGPEAEQTDINANVTQPAVEDQQNPPGEDCTISAGYPDKITRWCNWIQNYAYDHGLDANLIAAVMLQESGGNPDAYSHSGAVGLMQVMPRDGLAAAFNCINGPCFANRPSMEELFEPEFNIAYGVRMLSGLISRKGDIREGLKSYGPMDAGYSYADKVLSIYQNYR